MEEKPFERGRVIEITAGEYSNYHTRGHFIVLEEFYPFKQVIEFLKRNPEMKGKYAFDDDAYLSFLCTQGLLLEIHIPTDHLHVGNYSNFKEMHYSSQGESACWSDFYE